jgi:hypothetical protein
MPDEIRLARPADLAAVFDPRARAFGYGTARDSAAFRDQHPWRDAGADRHRREAGQPWLATPGARSRPGARSHEVTSEQPTPTCGRSLNVPAREKDPTPYRRVAER